MKKTLSILTCALLLPSCAMIPVHKKDIQQGNVFTTEMTSRLHPGMSEAQVREIMGTPVLLNTFKDNRTDYVYTYQPGGGKMSEKYITLIFNNGILREMKGDMYSQYIKS